MPNHQYIIAVRKGDKPGQYQFTRLRDPDAKTLAEHKGEHLLHVISDGKIQPLSNSDTALYILSIADKAQAIRKKIPKLDEQLPDKPRTSNDVIQVTPESAFQDLAASYTSVFYSAPKPKPPEKIAVAVDDYRYARNMGVIIDIPHFTKKFEGAHAHGVSETMVGAVKADVLLDRMAAMGMVPYLVQEDASLPINNGKSTVKDTIRQVVQTGELPGYDHYNMVTRSLVIQKQAQHFRPGNVIGLSLHFDGVGGKEAGMFVLPSPDLAASKNLAKTIIRSQYHWGARKINLKYRLQQDPDGGGIFATDDRGLQRRTGTIPFVLIEAGNGDNHAEWPALLKIDSVSKQMDALSAALGEHALKAGNTLVETDVAKRIARDIDKTAHAKSSHMHQLVNPPKENGKLGEKALFPNLFPVDPASVSYDRLSALPQPLLPFMMPLAGNTVKK